MAAKSRRMSARLQIVLIVGLLTASVLICLSDHWLWGVLLGVGGLAFLASFVLSRMVGDEYGRY